MQSIFVQMPLDDALDLLRDEPRRIMIPLGSRPSAIHIRARQLGRTVWSKKLAGQVWEIGEGEKPKRASYRNPRAPGIPDNCCTFNRGMIESMPRGRWRRFDVDPGDVVESILASRSDRWFTVKRDGDTWIVFRHWSEADSLLS